MKESISVRSYTIIILLFLTTVVVVQNSSWYVPLSWALGLLILISIGTSSQVKETAVICILYAAGFSFYISLMDRIKSLIPQTEWAIILSRLSLIGLLVWVYMFRKGKATLALGNWNSRIYFPFILKGPISDPVWRFLLIFTCITFFSFSWFVDWGRSDLGQMLLYAFCFALINAVLEEILWRGYILRSFIHIAGEVKGIIIAGVGFGFYHFHLGFSWWICLLFAVFGMMMSAVAVRSQGLLSVITMHFILNILFVLSGMIV